MLQGVDKKEFTVRVLPPSPVQVTPLRQAPLPERSRPFLHSSSGVVPEGSRTSLRGFGGVRGRSEPGGRRDGGQNQGTEEIPEGSKGHPTREDRRTLPRSRGEVLVSVGEVSASRRVTDRLEDPPTFSKLILVSVRRLILLFNLFL